MVGSGLFYPVQQVRGSDLVDVVGVPSYSRWMAYQLPPSHRIWHTMSMKLHILLTGPCWCITFGLWMHKRTGNRTPTISTRSEPYVIYLGPNQREGGLRRLASRRLPLFLALKGITVCATEMFGFVLLMCLVPQSFICTYASDKGTDFCIQNGRANSFIIPSLSASFAGFIHFSFIMHMFTSQAKLLDVIIIPLFGVSFCLICKWGNSSLFCSSLCVQRFTLVIFS